MEKQQDRIIPIIPKVVLLSILSLGYSACNATESVAIEPNETTVLPANSNLIQDISSNSKVPGSYGQKSSHRNPDAVRLSEPSVDVDSDSSTSPERIWDRVRRGFRLPALQDEYVDHYERWYSQRPDYLHRLVERAGVYLPFIVQQVAERGFPMEIALLPAIESAFKPNAYSKSHAAGLWQFIPATGERFGLKQNWWYDGRRDVIAATRAAMEYLGELNHQFDGDWLLTLAAYNGGEQHVHRAIQYNRELKLGVKLTDLKLRSESRRYVPKLIALRNLISQPQNFGVVLSPVPTVSNLTEVTAPSQIDLGLVAKLTELSPQDIFLLNPAHRRWATDPNGPHRIFVPKDKYQIVQSNISNLGPRNHTKMRRYRIESGETLSYIAYRNGVDVSTIKSINRLNSDRININQELLIPVSNRRLQKKSRQVQSINNYGNSGHKIHHVRDGDTLWRIAQQYKVYVSQLLQWNMLSPDGGLDLGQQIIVYKK